jgi:hypothetical protein
VGKISLSFRKEASMKSIRFAGYILIAIGYGLLAHTLGPKAWLSIVCLVSGIQLVYATE